MTEQQQIIVLDTFAKDVAISESNNKPDNLIVIGYFQSNELKQFFVEQIAKKQAQSDETVTFYACPLDGSSSSDVVALIETYNEGDLLGEKEYSSEERLEEIQSDINMFVMAELFAHKFADQMPDEDDEEEEEEEEEESEEEDEEEEEEADEDEEEEEDEDEEEEEEGEEDDEEDEEDDGETVVLTHITQQDLQPAWSKVYEDLSGNSLAYTTFRNSVGGVIRDVLFVNNPVMKMMAQISDPSAPERQDLLELVNEASQLPSEAINPPVSDQVRNEMKNILDLKKKFVEQSTVADEFQYFLQFEEEESEVIKQHEQQQKMEWKTFGADLQRLQIGSTFSIGRGYRGQFRVLVDPEALQYQLFDFEHDEADEKQLAEDAEHVRQYILSQAHKFKESSKRYRIRIPFGNISAIHYHASQVDPGLGLLVVDLVEYPEFAVRSITEKSWTSVSDFTVDQMASKNKRHYVVGNHEELSKVLSLLLSSNDSLARMYTDKKLDLSAQSEAQTEVNIAESNVVSPFAHLNDDGTKEPSREEDGAEQQEGRE